MNAEAVTLSTMADMRYRRLGNSGLAVSVVGIGCNNFGAKLDAAQTQTVVDTAIDEGITLFDTADVYGNPQGSSEEFLGAALKANGRRDDVVVATKFGSPMNGINGPDFDARGSRTYIFRAVESSLRRLQTDHIDLYQIHRPDRNTPIEETLSALDDLVRAGKVRYVGSSNFAGWHLAAAQESAHRRHFLGLVSEQCIYNLITRAVELEVIPAAQAYGIGIIPWSPLHGGLLSGALRKLAEGTGARTTTGRAADSLEKHRPALEGFEKLCAEVGEEPSNVALAWLLARPGVTAPIVGPRTMEQLDGALRAVELTLSEETLTKLDELFPPIGDGGPGPEAWAW